MLANRPAFGPSVSDDTPTGRCLRASFDLFRTWLSMGDSLPDRRRFPDLLKYLDDDDRPNAVEYVVGDRIGTRHSGASVVLGAKRMVTTRPLPRQAGETEVRFPVWPVSASHKPFRNRKGPRSWR